MQDMDFSENTETQNVLDRKDVERFLFKIQKLLDGHGLRYAKIDFLYWFEFQNICSDIFQAIYKFLTDNKDLIKDQKVDAQVLKNLDIFCILVTALFDICNCDKLTNVAYFGLCDDIHKVFTAVFSLKLIGVEKYLMKVVELYDCLLILSINSKQQFKYANPNNLGLEGIINTFIGKFHDISTKISEIQNEEDLKLQQEVKVKAMKQSGFSEISGLEFDVCKQFEVITIIVQLGLNQVFTTTVITKAQVEKALPPQKTFQILTNIIANNFLSKEVKIQTVEVMGRLVQIDMVGRLGYPHKARNLYFSEAVKYSQSYIEILKKSIKYHTSEKLEEGHMIDEKDQDFIHSQSFLGDFLGYLDDIAKQKQRSLSANLFSQITPAVLDVISIEYIPYTQSESRYPLNFTCQIKALKLLKSILKTHQSQDDTKAISIVIQKLKDEICIVKNQAQYKFNNEDYANTFNLSWPDDDDYVSKYQTINQRHQLIKALLKFLCFFIVRSDPNIQSYNQNYVAHSRKILESSIIQDDLLFNIFKVYETLPLQTDAVIKEQIETTVTPIVLGCIQLVTQVFNDLPSKIQTFISNGVFQCVLNSLENGSIPVSADMLHIIASFMHMMTLNSEAMQLLINSKFMVQLCSMCLDPKKYNRFVSARRRDDFNTEQMLQNVANAHPELAEQMLTSFLTISQQIVPKSHKLLIEYVDMDKKLRIIEKKLNDQFDLNLSEDEITELINQKNQIKEPYEASQLDFENFFSSYYVINSYFIEQERGEASTNLSKTIAEHKKKLVEVVLEGLQNPAVASALHLHSEDYVTIIAYLLNSYGVSSSVDPETGVGIEFKEVINKIVECIKIQVQNVKTLLMPQSEQQSSLIENQTQFDQLDDMKPIYSTSLILFECLGFEREETREMQKFTNGDIGLSAEDQLVIVIRKIYLYVELLGLYLKKMQETTQQASLVQFNKTKYLFSIPGFGQIVHDLFSLSTLITKNRGINFSKFIKKDQQRLSKLIEKYGDEITKFDYGKGGKKMILNDLQRGRHLYYKYVHQQEADTTILKHRAQLSDSLEVMNFVCDDTICTHAQACQIQIKKLFRIIVFHFSKRKVKLHECIQDQPYEFNYQLGRAHIEECIVFINKGNEFINKFAANQLPLKEKLEAYDTILFDIVSGLSATTKIMQTFSLPGAFIRGILESVNNQKFIQKLLDFTVKVTQVIESLLVNGEKLSITRLSYIQVLWKDVSQIVGCFVHAKFLLSDFNLERFLTEFKSFNKDQIVSSEDYNKLDQTHKNLLETNLKNQAKVNLHNLIMTLLKDLSVSLFDRTDVNMFAFTNKYCPNTFFKTVLKVYDLMIGSFRQMPALKKLSSNNFGDHTCGLHKKSMSQFEHFGHVDNHHPQPRFELTVERGEQGAVQQVDEETLNKLQEMGFTKENIIPILQLTQNDFEKSMELLLEKQSAEEEDQKSTNNQIGDGPPTITQTPQCIISSFELNSKIEGIEVGTRLEFTQEFSNLICSSLELLVGRCSEDLVFNDFSFDTETNKIFGNKLRLDKIQGTITVLAALFSEKRTQENSSLIDRLEIIFQQYYSGLFMENQVNFEDINQIKDCIVKLYIYKKLNNLKYFGAQFLQKNPSMNPKNTITIFIQMLSSALDRLSQLFTIINNTVFPHTNFSAQELENNHLPLISELVQLLQEILTNQIMNDKICSEVTKIVNLAATIKDSSLIAPSEASTRNKVGVIEQYHSLLQDFFQSEKDENNYSSVRAHFEKLLASQIHLLKVYNNIPTHKYNHQNETLYPVALCILILKVILIVSDCQKQTDQTRVNYRKKFIQNDGLKYLFGIKIVDNHCSDPEEFLKAAKISDFMTEQLQSDLHGSKLIDSFVNTLMNNKQSMVQIYENYIKQHLFIQYTQNCKRDSKKDISQWFKPIFDGMDNNNQSMQSPKATKKQNNKPVSQSMKKAKSENKKVPQEITMTKGQSKQLKVLMNKNESYNEVPLKQFIEFFLKSGVSIPIDYFEFFLVACKNICEIDVSDNDQENKTTKITTIKLKNSVLKEMILLSKNDPLNEPDHQKHSAHQQTWLTEYKKSLQDVQPQAEIISNLLDIFISQIKGKQMNILKCLRNNKLQCDLDFNLKIQEQKLIIDTEQADNETKSGFQMQNYLFDSKTILRVISNEFTSNPVHIGTVLKHKEQKTFKYIIRNILPLQFLRIKKDKQVVFEENSEPMDQSISVFFKRMLLETHTIPKYKKIYRQEARRVFVKEVTKNLIESEPFDASMDKSYNFKLMQNYGAILLISKFLTVPDQNHESGSDQRIRALYQSIRRYNIEQKTKILNQILYETQIQKNEGGDIKVNFFKQVKRIQSGIENQTSNIIVAYRPKALVQCIEVIIQIINQLAKNSELWSQLRSQKKKVNSEDASGKSSRSKKKTKSSGKSKPRKGTMEVFESESEQEEDENSMMEGLQGDPDLTLEDQQDIEQMRDEDRRSNMGRQDDVAWAVEEQLSDIDDDSYGQEEGEEEMQGEFSDQSYGEEDGELEEGMEDAHEYYDEDASSEEGEAEMLSMDDADDLLVNSQEDLDSALSDGADSYGDIGESSVDDEDMEGDGIRDGDGFSDGEDSLLADDPDDLPSRSYGDEFSNQHQDFPYSDESGARDYDAEDNFTSSMNSLYPNEWEGRGRDQSPELEEEEQAWGRLPQNPQRPNQIDLNLDGQRGQPLDMAQLDTQLAQYGLSRVGEPELHRGNFQGGRRPRSRSLSPESQHAGRASPFRHADAGKNTSLVPSKFTFDHPNSFGRKFGVKGEDRWEDAKKDIEKEREMLNSISSFLSVREKYNIFNRVFSTLIEMLQQIRKLIRVDENLYMQSIPMVNNQNIANSVVPTILPIQSTASASSLIDTATKAIKLQNDDDQNHWKNQAFDMSNVRGYPEFQKALKQLSGEFVEPEDEQKQPDEPEQINSLQTNSNIFDQIDPVFTSALNAPAIQAIKESDQLIKQIQRQSSLQSQQQIQTINEFLKNQSDQVRTQILKNLDGCLLGYLTSDLYAEAKRLRQPQQQPANPQQQPRLQLDMIRPDRHRCQQRGQRGANRQLGLGAQQSAQRSQALSRPQFNNPAEINLRSEALPILQEPRNRFMSMESQTLNIDDKMPTGQDPLKKQIRDSESEDLNIPQQKSNFHQNAFFYNLHTYMKDNLESLKKQLIRDTISSQANIATQIYTHEDLQQYLDTLIISQFKNSEKPEDSNIKQIVFILEIAIAEILSSKAINQLNHTSPERQLARFKVITQIPNFRTGLIVKMLELMGNEMIALQKHIADNRAHPTIYKGKTSIWELPMAEKPTLISAQACISFILRYIYELQQIVFETKGSSKVAILDILQTPNQNQNLLYLYKTLGILTESNCNRSLLDQALSMISDYIHLVSEHPQFFENEESQQKEFNRWKQEILQHLTSIISQLNVGLNIIIRQKPNEEEKSAYLTKYSFNSGTLLYLFNILFFPDSNNDVDNMFLDNSPKTVKMISRVLGKLAALPIIDSELCMIDFDAESLKNIQNQVVYNSLSQKLDLHLSQFTKYFQQQTFQELDKGQLKDLTIIIDKIQFIIDVMMSLSEQHQTENICQKLNLTQILDIVQQIINSEEQQTAFLYKPEFIKIMQLIFSLSDFDLKQEVDEPLDITGKQSKRKDNKKKIVNSVLTESIEEIKSEFEELVIQSKAKDNQEESVLSTVLKKYKHERVRELITFFFENRKLINSYICLNQSVISEQFQNLVVQVPEILDFDSKRLLWKICIKKHLKAAQKNNGDMEIDLQVRRNQVFGDSFEQLRHIQLDSWKTKFTVEFHDEEGVDEGGLTKEWFELLSRGIFDPNYALFLQSGKGSTYYPNPNSSILGKDEMLALFKFVGRFIGKAIIESQLLDCYFVKALYKMMLGDKIQLKDLEDYDEQIYKSLVYMLENDAEMLCQSFVFSSKLFDKEEDIELKEGGKDIDVTNSNKYEYCQLVLKYRLYGCIQEQVDAFLQGFHELVPKQLIKIFDYKELELLMSGLPIIDIDDLKENTIYKGYNSQCEVVRWLWEVLEEFGNSERAEFLQFVTGSSKVPVEGFKGLRCNNGLQKFQVTKYQTDNADKRLPQAHTCFFQLDLPEYTTKDILRERILTSITEGKSFGIA